MNPTNAAAGGWGRRVFCKHYGQCLDWSVARGWRGFSCLHCEDHRPTDQRPEFWREDALRCVRLYLAVMGETGQRAA
jgi:hypothetical protein